MNDHEILAAILFGIFAILGFLMKRSIAEQDLKIRDLKDTQHNLEVDLASTKQNYLHKDDFKEFKIELRSMFEEIRTNIRSLNELRN